MPADGTERILGGQISQIGAAFYLANMLVGGIAQLRLVRFGWLHHALYAVVFVTALAALAFEFHPALLVTVAALALLPRTPVGGWRHPALAVIGLIGYVLRFVL